MQATLSHYRILEPIGSGGMGVVFRAHDEHLDRDVAIKVLPPGTLAKDGTRRHFHKEALVLSRLSHPNIATVHDFDTEADTQFLVEEFIAGRSLDTILAFGPLPENEILRLSLQLADGLAAAHQHGIIHRDLKPANLRVTPEGRLKILDFGLAIMRSCENSPTAVTQTFSETNSVAGTLPYMAPEQLLGNVLDARTDIWAVGCVLYEMATGQLPFHGGSTAAKSDAILHQAPPPIRRMNPKISPALAAIIEKCMGKQPDRRYQSATELADDLRRTALSPTGSGVRIFIRRSFLILALALAAIAAMILLVVYGRPAFRQIRPEAAATGSASAEELYLRGLHDLERWDKLDRLEAAISSFEQAVKLDSGFALGFSALAEAYWAKYRVDGDSRWIAAAERNCYRAAELNTHLPAIYVTLARIQNGKSQYNLALQEIQQALKLQPLGADVLLAQAAVYASMGRHNEADDIFHKAVALRPEHWTGYYELGVFYFRLQRYGDAAAQFQRVLELTPDNAMAHATLGGMLQILGKNKEAETHLTRSIELQPSYAAYNNLGVLYYSERRWNEAAAATRQALQINMNSWKAWSNLGLAYEWLGRNSEAKNAFQNELAQLKQAAKISSEDPEIQVELGLVYSKEKLKDQALPHLEAALTRSPDDPIVLVSASEAYENLGDRNRAVELVTRALSQGWTLAQLENDPGQQQILRDPRVRLALARKVSSAAP